MIPRNNPRSSPLRWMNILMAFLRRLLVAFLFGECVHTTRGRSAVEKSREANGGAVSGSPELVE